LFGRDASGCDPPSCKMAEVGIVTHRRIRTRAHLHKELARWCQWPRFKFGKLHRYCTYVVVPRQPSNFAVRSCNDPCAQMPINQHKNKSYPSAHLTDSCKRHVPLRSPPLWFGVSHLPWLGHCVHEPQPTCTNGLMCVHKYVVFCTPYLLRICRSAASTSRSAYN